MKKVEVYCGWKIYDDDLKNVIGYQGDHSGEGFIYKDYDAFENNPDEICYIPEGSFDEKGQYDDFLTVEEAKQAGETKNTIMEQIRDAWAEDYLLTDEQVEYFAKDVFGIADWACIATYLAENFEIEDIIEFDDIKSSGVFTQFQRDAVENGMTPKEYSERSLSYGELAQFDSEFDTAFVVDEDCMDDESENGLGDNARITYVECRRTGEVSGPEEFAEIYNVKDKWKKYITQ